MRRFAYRHSASGKPGWVSSCAGMTAAFLLIFSFPGMAAEAVDVTVYTTKGEVPLQLELAATPESRIQGLMHRDTLAPLDGMLFLFPKAHDYAFWMKDTRIPLDILFVNDEQRIVHIARDVAPYTKAERASGQPIVAVIELDGGRALKEAIAEGDHVRYDLPKSLEIR